MRRRRPLHGALAGLALVAALTTVEAPASAAQSDDREAAVRRVLDQREEAIRSGDRQRFLDTVDPAADGDFKARQGRLFDGLRSVPLASYELLLRTDEIADLSAGLDDRYAADDVFLPPIEARYRIEGADATDAIDSFFYTFLRRGGRWRIISDTDVEDLGLPSSRNLWDFGPVARVKSEHFTMLFDPGDRERAEALVVLAEEAHDRLAGTFDRPLPDQVVVVLPHTLDQLREMLQATFDLSNFVAFATAAVDRDRGWESAAPRVYVQDINLSRNRREFQLETLHHELIHVAAFPVAGPFVPAWVHEGVADWLSTGRGRPTAPAGTDKRLPDDHEFTTGGQDAILQAYEESTSAMAFLGEVKGKSAPLDVLATAGRPRVTPGTADHHLDRALREVYGAGFTDFERDWDGGR
ncbi:MAG TPA: hypothetical protein VI854_02000 [Acidimicrobiia bacterium]|nr:hypothetical protein [Acidimicrobiia bacterium]